MVKEYGKHKIKVYGTEKEINKAIEMLDSLNLTGNENTDRLLIQEGLDSLNGNADVLYSGNTVYPMNKIIKEARKLIKSGTLDKMSDSFYKFLTNACGSIGHYDKNGWISTYNNSAIELKKFFKKNEYGTDVVSYQPRWATDRMKIAKALLEL